MRTRTNEGMRRGSGHRTLWFVLAGLVMLAGTPLITSQTQQELAIAGIAMLLGMAFAMTTPSPPRPKR